MASTTQAASEAAGNAAGAAGHAAEKVGMPQLDFATYPNQIFWLVVALIAIYLILSRVALPRIGGILADRQGAITNDIAAAEDLKQKAVEAEAAYGKALTDARSEASRIVAEARDEIQKDLDVAIAKADAEIAAKSAESAKLIDDIRASALTNVTEVAKDTAAAIVAALGAKADAKAVDAAVTARLKG